MQLRRTCSFAGVNYGHPNERETPDPHRLVELTAFGTSDLSPSEQVSRAERDNDGVPTDPLTAGRPIPVRSERSRDLAIHARRSCRRNCGIDRPDETSVST